MTIGERPGEAPREHPPETGDRVLPASETPPVAAHRAAETGTDIGAISEFLDELSRDFSVSAESGALPAHPDAPSGSPPQGIPAAPEMDSPTSVLPAAEPGLDATGRRHPIAQLGSLLRLGRRMRPAKAAMWPTGESLAGAPPVPADAVEIPIYEGAEAAFPGDLFPEPSAVGLGRLLGNLDIAGRNSVSGWALNEADPLLPVGLVVSADGRVITRVLANRFRADLQRARIGNGSHGFQLMFPELSPLIEHELHVTREADGAELPGSPKIIPAAQAFDADAESGIASILTDLDHEAEARALAFLLAQADRLLSRRADRDSDREARHLRYLFRRRWGRVSGADDQWAPKDEPLLPRALVIDDYLPDPGRDAGSVAILSHIRALQALGYEVSLVAARDMENDSAMERLRSGIGIAVCGLPFYYSVEDVLKRQSGLFDLIYLHRISNARKYMMLARTYQSKARIVYSVADLHHVRLARQGEVERLDGLMRISEQMAIEEFTAARQADAVITHSEFEAGLLRRRVAPRKVHVVPWAVPARPCTTPFAGRSGLAVIGHFGHKPNPDSVYWLLRYVMPAVWDKDPAIRCAIVGHGWNEGQFPRRDSRVDIVGPLADLREIFDRVRLTVAPLRFGAGIKGKVLESFAAGIPCVMSPIAAEGLPLPPELLDLVTGGVQAMAAEILRLHGDEASNAAASAAGLEMIRQSASEQVIIDAMAKVVPLPQAEASAASS